MISTCKIIPLKVQENILLKKMAPAFLIFLYISKGFSVNISKCSGAISLAISIDSSKESVIIMAL